MMAVTTVQCTSLSNLMSRIAAAGFGSVVVSSDPNYAVTVDSSKYNAIRFSRYSSSTDYYRFFTISLGTWSGSAYTAAVTLHKSGSSSDPFGSCELYYDHDAGWFVVFYLSSGGYRTFFYHGKLSNGEFYSFVLAYSVDYVNPPYGGVLLLENENRGCYPVTMTQFMKDDEGYLMQDIAVADATGNYPKNTDGSPATVIGLKNILANVRITGPAGQAHMGGYYGAGTLDHTITGIFIPGGGV